MQVFPDPGRENHLIRTEKFRPFRIRAYQDPGISGSGHIRIRAYQDLGKSGSRLIRIRAYQESGISGSGHIRIRAYQDPGISGSGQKTLKSLKSESFRVGDGDRQLLRQRVLVSVVRQDQLKKTRRRRSLAGEFFCANLAPTENFRA
jgi:hypothetical protein